MSTVNVRAKRVAASHQAARKNHRKAQRQRERRCFWTSPLGHRYVTFLRRNECAGCGKTQLESWT